MTPESDRDVFVRQARIYLREARARSRNPAQRSFCFALIQWAGDCRRRAMNSMDMRDLFSTEQRDLFGDAV